MGAEAYSVPIFVFQTWKGYSGKLAEAYMSVDTKHKRTSSKHEKEHPKIRTVILHNVLITLLIMGISTIMAQAFFHYSKNSTSVAIIYVLAVMLVARYTIGYITGIIAAVFGVFLLIMFFTFPYMNFNFP